MEGAAAKKRAWELKLLRYKEIELEIRALQKELDSL